MTAQDGQPFSHEGMASRQAEYFKFIQTDKFKFFTADCKFQPTTQADGRLAFWMLPALMATDDPESLAWANKLILSGGGLDNFNMFISSSVAANLIHCRKKMSPELILRSEEHLSKTVLIDGGRQPCARANDYNFHGWNDNMPAMTTRQMIFAGDILDRKDFTDFGLLRLEMLCAHFQRRGLISEHTSGTYLPITLTAIMDIAEMSSCKEAREMALACANRILLDFICHWHKPTGALGGVQCRAYMTDYTSTLSNFNALMWYLTGSPMLLNPVETLRSIDEFRGRIQFANAPFLAGQYSEFMVPSYKLVDPRIIEFAKAERPDDYTVKATTDYAKSQGARTHAHHRKLWCLATSSSGAWWSAHHTFFQGTLACLPKPKSCFDRFNFWISLNTEEIEYGDPIPDAGGIATSPMNSSHNSGDFHCIQNRGTSLASGILHSRELRRDLSKLIFTTTFSAFGRLPDEAFEGDEKLTSWDGIADSAKWQFLRYGDVYIGVRMAGSAGGEISEEKGPLSVLRRKMKNGYLRLDLDLLDGRKVTADEKFQSLTDFACAFEISDRSECGSFEEFRKQCLAGKWEFYRWSDRYSRLQGRNGELFLCDSNDGTLRFSCVNGETVPEPELIEATGLDPALVKLFPDGRKIHLRSLLHDYAFAGSPYCENKGRVFSSK